MEKAEHSRYVTQLKAEFDSCDTTATGFLDRDELTVLCQKLHLDAHLPLLLDTLLGERTYARVPHLHLNTYTYKGANSLFITPRLCLQVNFEEFKEGFVAVLSRSLDFSTSEDDSSYLEPVVPDEVKPKFVKGTKRYGRRSRPDNQPDTADSEDSPPSRTKATDLSPPGVRRAKLRRSTSLESVERLRPGFKQSAGTSRRLRPGFRQSAGGRHGDYVQVLDSLRGRHGDYVQVLDSLRGRHGDYVQVLDSLRGRHGDYVQVLDSLRGRHRDYVQVLDSLRGRHRDYVQSLKSDEEAGSLKEKNQPDFQSKGPQQEQVELGVVGGGGEGVLCDHLSLQQEVDEQDRASIKELQKVLCGSAPISCSTPVRSADLQRAPHRESLQVCLESLENLENLESLENLENLESLVCEQITV
ncbi:Ninein-like protein [Collichthys lucidus]|uniref:Ninein-like protein n=1 Tax=Collichthys lucidus TaxID=240159 RepID=A0A4U5TV74_COLLU|nr:Ninein-like protein [Collichthys lucidus]